MNVHYSHFKVAGDVMATARRLIDVFGVDDSVVKLADIILMDCGVFFRKRSDLIMQAARVILETCIAADAGHLCSADKAIQCVPSSAATPSGAEGLQHPADKAISRVPTDSRSHDDGKGHGRPADKARSEMPAPSSPNCSGEGHSLVADKAIKLVPSPAATQHGGQGHVHDAGPAREILPTAAVPNCVTEGRGNNADKAIPQLPSVSQPSRDGEGHESYADKASCGLPSPSAGATLAERKATLAVWNQRFVSVFKITIDGKSVANMTRRECLIKGRERSIEGQFLSMLANSYPNIPLDTKVKDFAPEKTAQNFFDRAMEMHDVVE